MLRLLIVDDEFIIRNALSEMIDYEAIGYELVGSAKNGIEALNLLNDEYPDVVITDIRMPVLSGLELIARAQAMDNQIDFIVLSGYDDFEYARQAMRYGVKHYLLKPTDRLELVDALNDIRTEILRRRAAAAAGGPKADLALRSFYQQAFVMEGLESGEHYPEVFKKYYEILGLGTSVKLLVHISGLKGGLTSAWPRRVYSFLEASKSIADFPLLLTEEQILFISPFQMLSQQDVLAERLLKLLYSSGAAGAEVQIAFERAESTKELFQKVFAALSAYQHIHLLFKDKTTEAYNSLFTAEKLRRMSVKLKACSKAAERQRLLAEIIPDELELPLAKSLAASLCAGCAEGDEELKLWGLRGLGKIFSAKNTAELREILAEPGAESCPEAARTRHVQQLKQYVAEHLADENLSLKFIAEHHLFVNVDYLSKQFVRTEGIRFSQYLTACRMDEALRLLKVYKTDNIKNIACRVGFGNNPNYFSQVFKRYTGMSPSDYLKSLTGR